MGAQRYDVVLNNVPPPGTLMRYTVRLTIKEDTA